MGLLGKVTELVQTKVRRVYEQVLEREVSKVPSHVAVIQDGNRRYAQQQGQQKTAGHKAGAETTEQVLRWCDDLGVEELTLYAFSTENFKRPPDEKAALFDLIADRLYSIADQPDIHERQVCINAIGETFELPARVQDAIEYAESQTAEYDQINLNIALAYGGRNELLEVAQEFAHEAAAGDIAPEDVTFERINDRLMQHPTQPVDLIIRTGGEQRTSNFLPWHANGNESAVYFCTPYWPAFSRADLLRAMRTYEAREESWQQARVERIKTLLRVVGEFNVTTAEQLGNDSPRSPTDSVDDD